MSVLLKSIIVWALSSFILKLVTALGLAFFSYKTVTYLVDNAILYTSSFFQQLPVPVLQILGLAGVPESLSILASALIVVSTIKSLKVWVGLGSATS